MTLEDIMQDDKRYIDQFRHRLKGQTPQHVYDDNGLLRRFLIARNYDLEAAEEMLKNNLTWRKVNKIDTILNDYTAPEVLQLYVTMDSLGNDKNGSPVIFMNIGNMDLRGLEKCVNKTDLIRFVVHYIETTLQMMKMRNEKLGNVVDTFVWIFNLDNFSFATATHKPTILMLLNLVSVYEQNYPERLKEAYVINTSYYVTLLLNILKPLIAGRTLQKAKFFAKDGWKEELLKAIDADVLPEFLGGTRTDPDGDPMCKTFLHLGGTIPESYYNVKKKSFSQKQEAKKLIVKPFSKAQVKLVVLHPGSMIEYEFETKSRDIDFSLIHKDNDRSKENEIVSKQRIETNMNSETGLFHCDRNGIYILEFDNSYSWFHQKEVYYTATVINPGNGT